MKWGNISKLCRKVYHSSVHFIPAIYTPLNHQHARTVYNMITKSIQRIKSIKINTKKCSRQCNSRDIWNPKRINGNSINTVNSYCICFVKKSQRITPFRRKIREPSDSVTLIDLSVFNSPFPLHHKAQMPITLNSPLNAEGSLLKWAQHPWSLIIISRTYAARLQEIIRFVCQIGNPEKLICYDMLSKIFKQQNPEPCRIVIISDHIIKK